MRIRSPFKIPSPYSEVDGTHDRVEADDTLEVVAEETGVESGYNQCGCDRRPRWEGNRPGIKGSGDEEHAYHCEQGGQSGCGAGIEAWSVELVEGNRDAHGDQADVEDEDIHGPSHTNQTGRRSGEHARASCFGSRHSGLLDLRESELYRY